MKRAEKEWEERFIAFIFNLFNLGMAQLGKIPLPGKDKPEKNLEAAKETIELLRMIKEKTKGNLTEREEKSLASILTNLQLNYVEELKREERKEETEK